MSDEKRVYRDCGSGVVLEFGGDGYGGLGVQKALDLQKRRDDFKAGLVGLQRFAEANKLQVYFLTLTMGNPVWGDRTLNRYMSWLRGRYGRKGLLFKYKWVLEPQEKRFEETGVLAPHWHIAVAVPPGTLPNVEYLPNAPRGHRYHLLSDGTVVKQRDLFKFWGYGQELCQPARGSLVHYLMKYLMKALELEGLGRRFGGSNILWWRIAKWAYECVRQFWDAGVDVLKVWFTRGDVARLLHFTVTDGVTMETYNVESPWHRVLEVNADA